MGISNLDLRGPDFIAEYFLRGTFGPCNLTMPKVDLFTKACSLVFSSVHDGEVYDQGRYSVALVYQHRSLKV